MKEVIQADILSLTEEEKKDISNVVMDLNTHTQTDTETKEIHEDDGVSLQKSIAARSEDEISLPP